MVKSRLLKSARILLWSVVSACSTIAVSSGGGFNNISRDSSTPSGSPGPGLPRVSYKQNPGEITFHECPPEGDGGDPVLNQNKNRVDDGKYQPTDSHTILALPWPQEGERPAHDTWSSDQQNQVAQAEGLPVSVVGYLALARQEGPEPPNCHSTTDVDFHIWLIDHAGGSADRVASIVVEATPRVRVNHDQWTVNNLLAIAQAGTQVRISGWLMLDPEHPEQIDKTRGTLWEIHPIMQIEMSQNGQWVPLDNGSVPQGGNTSPSGNSASTKTSTSGAGSGQATCPDMHY